MKVRFFDHFGSEWILFCNGINYFKCVSGKWEVIFHSQNLIFSCHSLSDEEFIRIQNYISEEVIIPPNFVFRQVRE